MDTCTSKENVAWLVGASSFLLLSLTLFSSHLFHFHPPSELGNRPLGTGLPSYLYHFFKDGVGMWGFDPVLGAFSPPLRSCFHLFLVLLCWSAILIIWPSRAFPDYCVASLGVMASVIHSGALAVVLYSLEQYVIHTFLPAVSDQGPPHSGQRDPKFDDTFTAPPSSIYDWKCVVADRSHDISKSLFKGTSALITGESYGRQTWVHSPSQRHQSNVDENLVQEMASGGRGAFGFNPRINPNTADQPFRAQMIREYLQRGNKAPDTSGRPKTMKEAMRKGAHFYSMLQTEDGHWAGSYSSVHFLISGLVIGWYIMGCPALMFGPDEVELIKHHILVHQQADGGWGTHTESPSTMIGTVLMYVALRLLGVEKNHRSCVKGRSFIHRYGGALTAASWAKFYLCILGVMDWQGHNSVPPELWLLPDYFWLHPGRIWCHVRMIYLPMSYLYSRRFVYNRADTDPTVLSLREELYLEDFNEIPWNKTRHWIAPTDNYTEISLLMKTLHNLLACYENWSMFEHVRSFFRHYANKFMVDYLAAEDLQTNYVCIGPVSKVLNMLSAFDVVNGDLSHSTVVNHILRVHDYVWVAEDGMKMQSYNGSQIWDTSFALQAYYEAGLLDEFPDVAKKAWTFLDRSQILCSKASLASPLVEHASAENRKKYYRHYFEGGWAFSTSAQGWAVSDCTGECMKGIFGLLRSKAVQEGLANGTLGPIPAERLEKAVNVLLTLQNEDGGWSTYENTRGYWWYKLLNVTEAFDDATVDPSYVECTMTCITALHEFQKLYPKFRSTEIEYSISIGREFLKSIQREDGSWYGSWGLCFTYGTYFGIEGLVTSGEPFDSPHVVKACNFLLKHQRPNGGWGEDFTACYDKTYPENGMKAYGDEGSSVVHTAYVLLALSVARCQDKAAIRRGVQYLMKRQLPCGDWPQEGLAGCTNHTLGIQYTAYRNVFPIWALGRCQNVYGDDLGTFGSFIDP